MHQASRVPLGELLVLGPAVARPSMVARPMMARARSYDPFQKPVYRSLSLSAAPPAAAAPTYRSLSMVAPAASAGKAPPAPADRICGRAAGATTPRGARRLDRRRGGRTAPPLVARLFSGGGSLLPLQRRQVRAWGWRGGHTKPA